MLARGIEAKTATAEIWRDAWLRFERKVLAKSEVLRAQVRRDESRGKEPREISCTVAEPIAAFGPRGQILWSKKIKSHIATLGKITPQHGATPHG